MSARSPKYPLARLSPAKDEILVIAITRESVMTGDIAPMLEKLTTLSSTREAALQWEGKLTFVFEGWDQDPRETAEIPEIRAYFATLTEAWPHWLHFGEKVGDTIPHVLRLLCRGRYERPRPRLVGWRFADFDDIKRLLARLFCGQNAMYDPARVTGGGQRTDRAGSRTVDRECLPVVPGGDRRAGDDNESSLIAYNWTYDLYDRAPPWAR